jgi:hypothetical protein
MHKTARCRTALASLSILSVVPVAVLAATTPSAEAATGRYFANCDALHKVWRHGVAKGPKAAQAQVRQGNSKPASGPKARAVYKRNYTRLDRDRDGTACEV